MLKTDPEFSNEIEKQVLDLIDKQKQEEKFRANVAQKAVLDETPAALSTVKQTRAAAKAKLDIAIDDDEE